MEIEKEWVWGNRKLWGSWEEWGGVTVVSMYCMREESVFNKEKRKLKINIFFKKDVTVNGEPFI